MSLSPEVLKWFEEERGIRADTLEHFGVRQENGAVIFPYGPGVEKKRYGIPSGDRKFIWPTGVPPRLFNAAEGLQHDHVFLVEGETDTMRLWQELKGSKTGVVGLPGIETWSPAISEELQGKTVYVILDNDQDYNVKARVDLAWSAIRRDLGRRAQRIYLPSGVKDICEFFQYGGTLDSLRELVKSSPERFHYQAIDFTQPVPEYEWIVRDFIAVGDVVNLIGEPGLGKSALMQHLAVSIVEGRKTWMGRPLEVSGRVLYVDEENPEAVVRHRIAAFGLTKPEDLRYLSQQGVRLDTRPDWLLEEALTFEPKLIVLDSLARIHTKEENSTGDMAALYNDGIKPLSREVGATVVVIHHVGKSDTTTSFRRSRGSGDITGAADAGIDVIKTQADTLRLVTFKSRRVAVGRGISVRMSQDPTGELVLEAGIEGAPF